MCDVQQAPLKLWRRAPLEGRGCVLSGWGIIVSTWEVLSAFGAMGSSLLFVGFLLSSCQGLHLTSFSDLFSLEAEGLLSRCVIHGDNSLVVPRESTSVFLENASVIWSQVPCASLGIA